MAMRDEPAGEMSRPTLEKSNSRTILTPVAAASNHYLVVFGVLNVFPNNPTMS